MSKSKTKETVIRSHAEIPDGEVGKILLSILDHLNLRLVRKDYFDTGKDVFPRTEYIIAKEVNKLQRFVERRLSYHTPKVVPEEEITTEIVMPEAD